MSTSSMRCNICGADTEPFATGVVLGKHRIKYYSCNECRFIQTETPYWLEEAYSSAIARSDIGLIGRNTRYSRFCSALIPILCNTKSSFLDYGGGNGMFVRMMRDQGFDFYWHDKYASNQFAMGCEAPKDVRFSLLTCFEVFEHLPQPLETIEEMFRRSDTVIFSTRLLPRRDIVPNDWWYFAQDTGQHVSFYSRESLDVIAKKFRVRVSTNGISLHILSSRTIPGIVLKALSLQSFAFGVSGLFNIRRKSLLEADYRRLTGRQLI